MYKFAITRPVSTLMFALAVMFFGFLAVLKLPVSLFPNIDFPIVTVITTYQGASAQTVETKVTDKIEEAVMGIDGLKKVTSSSVRNTSIVIIEFQLEKDLDVAVADVRDKIGTVRLESGIDSPSVRKVDTGSAPVISLFLTSTKVPPSEMMKHADNVIKPMLQKISGVGGVELRGYRKRQIRIYPDPTLMNKYGLTFSNIGRLIGQENVEIDGGRLVSTTYEWALTTDANSYSIEDMGELRVADGVRLKDIARIEDSIEEDRTYASYDKTPGVIFEVQKISGQNDIKIADSVKKVFPEILALSQDYEVQVFKDTTQYIKDSVNDVKFDLLLGAILAVVIVFVFLRSVSITIVAALSLPVSIIGTFALMSYFDLTLNMLTLLALTLAIGIIIDDAIVVIENIHKKLESGLPKREAAYEGVREIGFAIIAISAMLLSVFIPVGTMSGIVGRFFQSFGITVALAIGLSYIVVITIIPMLSSIVVSPQHSRFYHWSEPFFRKLDEWYVRTLRFVLSHKLVVLLAVIGVFAGSLFLAGKLGFDFMKKEDKGEYNVFLEVAPGISMEEMKRRAGVLQDIILADSSTEFATLQIGYNSQKNIFKAQIYTKMLDRKERTKEQGQFEIMDKMRSLLAQQSAAEGMTISIVEVSDFGGGDNSPFQIAILAPNDELLKQSQENLYKLFEEKLAGKVVGVHLNKADDQPEYRFHIVRANANKYGVSSEEIGNTIRAAFSGEYPVGYYKERGKEYDITVRVPDGDRRVLEDIKRLQVKNAKGELMFLEGLVKIEKTMTPSTITRFNRQRSMSVYASPNTNAGVSLGDIFQVVLDPSNKWLAEGASYKLQGEAENMQETIEAFVVAILTAIVLIYLILAALYESFLQPLIIMITLPLSFSGAFIALFLTNETFSMFSMLGLMLLMGMVGKNATLLIDVANEKRKEGMEMIEALITAGELRLRPILMTTIAMVFGMLPLAIANGAGEAMKNPIGIAMIGGLIVSMLLSLLIVPVFYRFLAPLDDRIQKLYKPKEGDRF
ncbi:efflux RND transporter permease subunit [uncultured Helicobacter sp.]|uniref:efflux RND transporter permease subunit n=1 Tax=uncultured Helicobacter sp. TaxID=175537 RepID=UPI00375385C2